MINIYGEKVQLTKAQKREYIALLNGAICAEYKSRQGKILNALKEKGLVKITFAWGKSAQFERWM